MTVLEQVDYSHPAPPKFSFDFVLFKDHIAYLPLHGVLC
jgi:hypothetical protein